PSLMATAFNSPVNNLPEPLIAIWEPRSYPILLQFLAQGYDCPRKALINSPIHLLEAPDPQALENVNTPEEKKSALEKLKNKE
ncbi:MAG: molybdopterin-guanine dinucleotide biosynthesis protein MobA, partial [Haliscomenobacter sp.]|nr:molybdopterin-guanine dinucleotide biosynthesis protein MobA [Haliscomenobacter sp.]